MKLCIQCYNKYLYGAVQKLFFKHGYVWKNINTRDVVLEAMELYGEEICLFVDTEEGIIFPGHVKNEYDVQEHDFFDAKIDWDEIEEIALDSKKEIPVSEQKEVVKKEKPIRQQTLSLRESVWSAASSEGAWESDD